MVITAPLTSPMDEAPHSDRDPEPQVNSGPGKARQPAQPFGPARIPPSDVPPLIIAYHCASILAFARAYFAVIKTAGLL
jgi:hypothetical protein